MSLIEQKSINGADDDMISLKFYQKNGDFKYARRVNMLQTLSNLLKSLSYWEFCTLSLWETLSLTRMDSNSEVEKLL
jgi:hypothetical protein